MIIAADVSYFQRKVDSSYPREWLIIRGCDGDFLDPNASFNADWCRGAVAQGRMVGWSMYVVYRPGANGAILDNLQALGGPFDRLEIDIESWQGAIRGDRSDEINSLALDLAALVGAGNVWRYGNRGDLASIHPRPLPGQLTRVASYTSGRPTDVPNLIGWQYTNGVENHTGNPATSAPFGACDHNELYVDQPAPSGGGGQIGDDLDMGDYTQDFASINAYLEEIKDKDASIDATLAAMLTVQQQQATLLQKIIDAENTPAAPSAPGGPAAPSYTGTITLTPEATA
jgi:hypothetical protein